MKLFKNVLVAAAVFAAVVIPSVPAFAAGNASLSLGAVDSAVVGSTVGVSIYENGDNVNVVSAKLNYDQGSLQFVNVNAGGSAFDSSASTSGGGGGVEISRFVSGGNTVSGNQLVAVVNFRVLANSGTGSVSTVNGSAIASNGEDIWNGAVSSATISFRAPAPVAPVAAPAPAAEPETPAAPAAEAKTEKKTAPKTVVSGVQTIKASAVIMPSAIIGLLAILLGAAAIYFIRRRRDSAKLSVSK